MIYRQRRDSERAACVVAAVVAAGVSVAADTAALATVSGLLAVTAGVASARRNGVEVTPDQLIIYSAVFRTLRIDASSIAEVRVVPRRNFVTDVVGTPSGVASVVVTYGGGEQVNIESKTPVTLASAIDTARTGWR